MKGVFDISSLIPLMLGALLILLGLKNYRSRKEDFDVRYARYALGISLMISGLAKIFLRINLLWIIILIILVFIIFNVAAHIRNG